MTSFSAFTVICDNLYGDEMFYLITYQTESVVFIEHAFRKVCFSIQHVSTGSVSVTLNLLVETFLAEALHTLNTAAYYKTVTPDTQQDSNTNDKQQ